jgi:hypothetical protein
MKVHKIFRKDINVLKNIDVYCPDPTEQDGPYEKRRDDDECYYEEIGEDCQCEACTLRRANEYEIIYDRTRGE